MFFPTVNNYRTSYMSKLFLPWYLTDFTLYQADELYSSR